MANLSTGVVEDLAKGKTLKEIFQDGCIDFFSGTKPTTADGAETTRLVRVTKDGGTFVPGTKSTRQICKDVIGSSTEGHVFTLTIDGTEYTYTALAGSSTTIVAAALAALVDASEVVEAIAVAADIFIRARYGGNSFTCVSSGSGTQTVTTPTANVRAQGIQFGSQSGGVLAKESGDWFGNGESDASVVWWRLKANPTDSGAESSTLRRIDGTCSTTSGDAVLRSLVVETGVPFYVESFNITFPKVRT